MSEQQTRRQEMAQPHLQTFALGGAGIYLYQGGREQNDLQRIDVKS
jgi:hypothetical protein